LMALMIRGCRCPCVTTHHEEMPSRILRPEAVSRNAPSPRAIPVILCNACCVNGCHTGEPDREIIENPRSGSRPEKPLAIPGHLADGAFAVRILIANEGDAVQRQLTPLQRLDR